MANETTSWLTRDHELVKAGDTVWSSMLPDRDRIVTSAKIHFGTFADGEHWLELEYDVTEEVEPDIYRAVTMYGRVKPEWVYAQKENVDDPEWD